LECEKAFFIGQTLLITGLLFWSSFQDYRAYAGVKTFSVLLPYNTLTDYFLYPYNWLINSGAIGVLLLASMFLPLLFVLITQIKLVKPVYLAIIPSKKTLNLLFVSEMFFLTSIGILSGVTRMEILALPLVIGLSTCGVVSLAMAELRFKRLLTANNQFTYKL